MINTHNSGIIYNYVLINISLFFCSHLGDPNLAWSYQKMNALNGKCCMYFENWRNVALSKSAKIICTFKVNFLCQKPLLNLDPPGLSKKTQADISANTDSFRVFWSSIMHLHLGYLYPKHWSFGHLMRNRCMAWALCNWTWDACVVEILLISLKLKL